MRRNVENTRGREGDPSCTKRGRWGENSIVAPFSESLASTYIIFYLQKLNFVRKISEPCEGGLQIRLCKVHMNSKSTNRKKDLIYLQQRSLETTFANLHRQAEANKCWKKQHTPTHLPTQSMIFVGTHHKNLRSLAPHA